jgi:hypothetical protein
MTALLDHRLSSVFSESIYDVQDTQPVNWLGFCGS